MIPEVLLVPLALGSEESLGTLWMVAEAEGHFDCGHARVASELAEFVGIALRMLKQAELSRRALEEQEILAQEMSHRLKNLFAVTDGMIRGTAKSAQTPDAMANALSGRLHALASAHSLVARKISDLGTSPAATELRDLVREVVSAHLAANGRDASSVQLDGPPVICGDHASNGLALVIHELATNATKYGALNNEDGKIEVTWSTLDDNLVLTWEETDGPPIETAPTVSGFGSTLIQRTIKGQFRGVLQRDWRPQGLAVTMTMPLGQLTS